MAAAPTARLMPGRLVRLLFSLLLALTLLPAAAFAARDTNSYDGNIYALYAGNGSLVPPRTTLVLFCSHFHQVEEDAAHGKRSPVVRLGTGRAAALVPWFVAGSLAFQWAPVLVGQWPLTALLSVAGLPPARQLIALLQRHHREPERIIGSKFLALRFQALSGLGLACGLAIGPLCVAGVGAWCGGGR